MGKRSSGCVTCRRRKVKCDEAKPICARCRKATYKCAGYDQPWLDDAPYEREAYERFRVRDELYRSRHYAFLPEEAIASQGFLPAASVAQELNLSAFREDICRSFLFHKLCSGKNFSKGMSWWLNRAPRAEIQSRTLVSASKAMTAAFFGRVHHHTRIIREGNIWYGEALRNLQSDLSHKVKAYTFETFGATMALNMYEMINLSSGSHAYLTHAGGIGKLIEARGPELHRSYPEKEMYLEARMLLIATALFSCQRTFLDERKWKDVPWEEDITAKSPFDYLVDVFSDIPCILQEVTHTNDPTAAGLPERPGRELLQKQVLERLQILSHLRKSWHNEYSTPVQDVPIAAAAPHGSDNILPPFDASIYFTSMFRAYEYCVYQMSCILLLLLYQDLSSGNTQPVEDILPCFSPHESVLQLARNICRCTEYLCLEQHGSRGYIVVQLPAIIAYFSIDNNSPEARWLYDTCKNRARSSGFGWGDFALDQVTPLSQWMASCRDRHRDARPNGHFAAAPKDRASGSTSAPCDAALRMRANGNPEEVARKPVLNGQEQPRPYG